MLAKSKIIILILICATLAYGQTVADKKPTEAEEKLRKDAVAFLRETLADVNSMRSLENRISFNSELAGLMWFHDEREARSMYLGAIGQFKDLIARYETRMNELGTPSEDEETGMPAGPFMFDPSERTKLLRKFAVVMGVRQALALSMAEHDPELAYNFYYDSLSMIANPALKQEADSKDSGFEAQLLTQLADKHPEKAAKFGKVALEKGFSYQHLDVLRKLHAKDTDAGREFGLAILSVIKDKKFDGVYMVKSLVEFGETTLAESKKPNGKRAVYTEPELRELVEVMAQEALDYKGEDSTTPLAYIETIQKYLPARAAQIRAKYRTAKRNTNSNSSANAARYDPEMPDYDGAIVTSSANTDAATRRREEREKEEKQLMEDIQGMSTKPLSKDEREKVVSQARKIIMTTPGRDKKIAALSLLAAQVAKLGDKELAGELMRDAERLVNPSPKNFQDFMLSMMLGAGYANTDPEKAFPVFEETIGRANEVLAAMATLGEFIDVNEDYISEGEVQVGAFGGQMVRGITRELNMADSTINTLARADFGKTKLLTNRFDRLEIRVLAKMLVLRAVLSPKGDAKVPAEGKVELSELK